LAAKFSSIVASSGTFSITNASSFVFIISGNLVSGSTVLGFTSNLISDGLLMVGFKESLSISNCETGVFNSGSSSISAIESSTLSLIG
jgi:hypothetical protein